jgi:glycerol-3-phosphate dehydrogenase
MNPSPLDERRRIWDEVGGDGPIDVLIVGGGINGAGALADAVTRGLDAVLVERDDLGVGTSSRSSKLIHGGLRYLERLELDLVRQGLAERDLLARLAPHLVTLRRFAVPVTGGRWQMPYLGAGLAVYDLLGGRSGGRFEAFGRRGAVRRSPGLDPVGISGGFEYTDGVCDDARVVLAVAETARRGGGSILTRMEVTGFSRLATGWEVGLKDRLDGGSRVIETRTILDATGAFESDHPHFRSTEGVVTSRGSHLVIAGDRLPGVRGMTIRVPGRVVFVVPWGRRWLIGTTDVTHEGPVDRPAATSDEVRYLLETVNQVLAADLAPSDVIATFAGIRPLAGEGAPSDTAGVSREHRIDHDDHGLVSVRGGKYTTYRRIAAEAVDVVGAFLVVGEGSTTDALPLAGASTPQILEGVVADLCSSGLDELAARWLVGRHGLDAHRVREAGEASGVDGFLHPEMPYLAAEAWWAIHREGALSLDDVLARRTRLAIETRDHGLAAAPIVAELLADLHGWSASDTETAIADYAASSSAEYAVP